MNKMRYLRIGIAAAVLVVIFALTFVHVPIGTLCALCPVGFAEIALAGGSIPWALLPGVLIVLVVVFLLGRVFCSWICPTSFLKNVFGGRTPRGLTGKTGACPGCAASGSDGGSGDAGDINDPDDGSDDAGDISAVDKAPTSDPSNGCSINSKDACAAKIDGTSGASSIDLKDACAVNPNAARTRNSLLSQGMVLAVLLIVSLIVHFPVFCLFCPIGLVFGTMFALSRMFITWQPGWELIVFPAMLAIELFLLKRWCSAICPLGFFFGVMSKARSKIGFLPNVKVDGKKCLHNEGCEVCAVTCPENICAATSDSRDLEDCTLCLDCKEHCPTRAISIGKGGK